MTKLVKLELENNKTIYVESTGEDLTPTSGESLASSRVEDTTKKLKDALSPISEIIESAIESVKGATSAAESIEIELAVKLSGDANLILCKTSGEAALKIKAVWKNS